MAAAPNLPPLVEAIGTQAVRQTVRLTLIQGGAAAAETTVAAGAEVGGAALAAEAVGTTAVAEGIAGGSTVLAGLGVAAAWTGVGLAVVGLGLLGYYLYKRSHPPAPACTPTVTPCPAVPAAPVAAARPAVSAAAPAATPVSQPGPKDVIKLKCKDDWDPCQKDQARAKVRELNKLADKLNGLSRKGTLTPQANRVFRRLKDMWAKRFRRDFLRVLQGEKPKYTRPSGKEDDFMDPCLYKQWKKYGLKGIAVDHVHDTGWSGKVDGPFKFLDKVVNEELGNQMREGDNLKVKVARRFELDCK